MIKKYAVVFEYDLEKRVCYLARKEQGQGEVALFGSARTSQQLRTEADKIITLDSEFLKDCWRSK